MSQADWATLPIPEVGDPYETYADRVCIALCTPLAFKHLVGLMVVMGGSAACAMLCAEGLRRLLPRVGSPFLICWPLCAFVAWRIYVLCVRPPRRPGRRCVKCGYDLRACTADRCPECGTPFDRVLVEGATRAVAAAQDTRVAKQSPPTKPG